jgi:uncharacterized membrane protein YgcG
LNFVVGLLLLVVAQGEEGGMVPLKASRNGTKKEESGTNSTTSPTATSTNLTGSNLQDQENNQQQMKQEEYPHTRLFHSNDEATALNIEEKVFWLFVVIVEKLMPPEMYGASLEGAQIAQEILWKWLLGERGGKFGVAKVARWVGDMESDGSSVGSGSRKKSGMGAGLRKFVSSGNVNGGGGGGGMPPLSMATT